MAQKGPLQCKRFQRLGHMQRNGGYAPGAKGLEAPTSLVNALPRGNKLSAALAEETTRRNTRAVLSGKKRRRIL